MFRVFRSADGLRASPPSKLRPKQALIKAGRRRCPDATKANHPSLVEVAICHSSARLSSTHWAQALPIHSYLQCTSGLQPALPFGRCRHVVQCCRARLQKKISVVEARELRLTGPGPGPIGPSTALIRPGARASGRIAVRRRVPLDEVPHDGDAVRHLAGVPGHLVPQLVRPFPDSGHVGVVLWRLVRPEGMDLR